MWALVRRIVSNQAEIVQVCGGFVLARQRVCGALLGMDVQKADFARKIIVAVVSRYRTLG